LQWQLQLQLQLQLQGVLMAGAQSQCVIVRVRRGGAQLATTTKSLQLAALASNGVSLACLTM
jgi:hypothetical protein